MGVPAFARPAAAAVEVSGHTWQQRRHKVVVPRVVVPEKKLIKKTSRSSGPGGQSVNVADSRVQLSFNVAKADWIEDPVKDQMKVIFKNRINKTGEISVACQVHSSQTDNYREALRMVEALVLEAMGSAEDAQWEGNKMAAKDWILEKKKKDGREKEIEKAQEAVKNQKQRSRDRTRNKKDMY